jgi:mannose-1-phosphate guanylyltransferase/mannose-6-phosphate isomerase
VSPPPASQCHLTGNEDIAPTAYPVEAFIEKPDLAHAQQFIADGNYYWNSGMLVARADAILRELEAAAPENHLIVEAAHQVAAHQDTTSYEKLPKISFDNAALERSHHVSVVPTTIGWSDVGSLLSLEALAEPNKAGTRIIGQGVDIDSTDTLNYSTERLVATLGLDNIMVVDTADATLVASRDRAQDVRLVVDALAQRGAPELKQSQTSLRPWGSWTMLTRGIGYQIKEIVVKGGASLSLQSHTHRSEHWIVVEGTAQVLRGEDELTLDASESVFIPAGTLHRLANPSTTPLRIVEVATGAYLGEDDITRYEDTYGR